MRKIVLTSVALIALAAPASANDIVKELLKGSVVAAPNEAGEVYLNAQTFKGNTQNAYNTSTLGNMSKYWDPNKKEYVFGSVSAVNVGNSISIEDVTPAPMTYTDVATTTASGKVTFASGTTAPVSGSMSGVAETKGLSVSGTASVPADLNWDAVYVDFGAEKLPFQTFDYDKPVEAPVEGKVLENAGVSGSISGTADLSGVVGTWSGTETTSRTVREFVKGDVYLNTQFAKGNTQNATIDATATAYHGHSAPSLENVSLTAANILNSVSIEDKSSQFRGEKGDVYVSTQISEGNTQKAKADVRLASIVGGSITAANIGNSINIKDACGVCK